MSEETNQALVLEIFDSLLDDKVEKKIMELIVKNRTSEEIVFELLKFVK